MLCQICKKKPAIIHIRRILNEKDEMLHLCAECAFEQSFGDPMLKETLSQLKVPELLAPLEKLFTEPSPSERFKAFFKVNLKCPHCQWTTADFRKMMQLGCPQCWEIFQPILEQLTPQWHVGTHHVDMEKKELSSEQKSLQYVESITRLERMLEQLIENENYEKAADIRDKIKILKSNFFNQCRGDIHE